MTNEAMRPGQESGALPRMAAKRLLFGPSHKRQSRMSEERNFFPSDGWIKREPVARHLEDPGLQKGFAEIRSASSRRNLSWWLKPSQSLLILSKQRNSLVIMVLPLVRPTRSIPLRALTVLISRYCQRHARWVSIARDRSVARRRALGLGQ
jgi:hypothetical protein